MSNEGKRFVLLEPTETGLTCGVYGLTAIEALGLLRAAVMWCESKMKEQISVVAMHPEKENR